MKSLFNNTCLSTQTLLSKSKSTILSGYTTTSNGTCDSVFHPSSSNTNSFATTQSTVDLLNVDPQHHSKYTIIKCNSTDRKNFKKNNSKSSSNVQITVPKLTINNVVAELCQQSIQLAWPLANNATNSNNSNNSNSIDYDEINYNNNNCMQQQQHHHKQLLTPSYLIRSKSAKSFETKTKQENEQITSTSNDKMNLNDINLKITRRNSESTTKKAFLTVNNKEPSNETQQTSCSTSTSSTTTSDEPVKYSKKRYSLSLFKYRHDNVVEPEPVSIPPPPPPPLPQPPLSLIPTKHPSFSTPHQHQFNYQNLKIHSPIKKKTRSKSAPINERKNIKKHLSLAQPSSTNLSPTSSVCQLCRQKNSNFSNSNNISLQDQLIRRTNFSRRNYGSLELLFTLDREGIIQNIGKFRIENGDSRECLNTSNTIHLENPESQTRWYFKYFLGRLHQNYLIEDRNRDLYVLSVVLTDANDRHILQYRVILWTKHGSQKLTLSYQNNKQITVKQILSRFQIECDKSPKEICDPSVQRELLILEEQEGSINFKFGIVYAKYGQLTDDEMLSNENGSPEYVKFLNLIGDKVKLKGWKRYRGGLDISSDTTGEHSIYTIYEGHEIMFHVSTLLPYTKDSKQQLERKRHIGNDIVTIVFQDCDENEEPDFTPSSARSQFQHIFALVTYNKSDNSYKLRIYSEQSVPPFGPSLPTPPVFTNHQEFREFLLVKLINGEKAAFNNTVFGKRKKRTIEAIIRTLYSNFEKDSGKNKPSSSTGGGFEALTDAFISGPRKKEEQRKAEFLRIGQNLKLQTIIKGDAPTSQITTGLIKRDVCEPQLFLQSFHHSVICSDSWNDWLVVGTHDGVFILDEAIPWDVKEIFDKSVVPRQLDICETYGLMIMLLDKGRVHIFRLTEFSQIIMDSSGDQSLIKTKIHCKDHRLEFINGCNVYAISKQFSNKTTTDSFQIASVCGKKVYLAYLKYYHLFSHTTNICGTCSSSSSTTFAQNFTPENEIANLFKLKKEINCSDVPQLINLIEASNETYILVAYKNKCELIDEYTGDCLRQFQINPLSVIRSIIDLYDSDQLELLLTHNYISESIKLDQPHSQSQQLSSNQINSPNSNNKTNYSFQWNSEPNFVLCAFPYVIGFATQSIEIRLLVNGNLVNSITMSNIKVLASKKDVYFSADHEENTNELLLNDKNVIPLLANLTINSNTEDQSSPPASPAHTTQPDVPVYPSFSNSTPTTTPTSKLRQRCTIYKMSFDFLLQTNTKTNDKFAFSQLCEDSKRTIQREMNNCQFIMIEPDDTRLSVYHRIITPNADRDDAEQIETIKQTDNIKPT